ncbi:MAG: Hsp20/alpha crystallin family protein [Thermodesulfovibrionales bacterium]|nr:Hsp20/alpha crystallin family protein [Thermodesulfovibrionales bacterium]
MRSKSLLPLGKRGMPFKKEDYEPFAFLRDELDRLFDNFFKGFEIEPFERKFATFSPSIDISETDNELIISAELPGIDEKDIDVSLTKDSLTIKGEKKEEKEEKSKNYYRMERSYGAFSRTIPLPAEIDTDKVEAEFKKGVLTIKLPKTPEAIKETKKIQIKSE